jgi:hypothetical protein
MPLRRVDSSDSATVSGSEPNRNTEFVGERGFWVYYACMVLAARILMGILLHIFPLAPTYFAWSYVHIFHTIVSFYLLHWVRGTPFSTTYEQGKYDPDTFWEQIDEGRQFTTNRKVFTAIPIILFLLAAYDIKWEHHSTLLFVDSIFLALSVVPKLPALDHVRIFGINKD